MQGCASCRGRPESGCFPGTNGLPGQVRGEIGRCALARVADLVESAPIRLEILVAHPSVATEVVQTAVAGNLDVQNAPLPEAGRELLYGRGMIRVKGLHPSRLEI